MSDDRLFRAKAPGIMRQLMADFDLTASKAAAVLGNIGHECAGFLAFQELKPLVAGSPGGFGWCMWTGSRRRDFEAYVARNRLDPKGDKANYGWLFVELTTTEKKAIPALKAASGLENEVMAFEAAFERAGVKHYESRFRWARIALDAFGKEPAIVNPMPSPAPAPPPAADGRSVGIGAAIMAALIGLFGLVMHFFGGG